MQGLAMEPKMLKNRLTPGQCMDVLDRVGEAVLSMVAEDGGPYAVPVNFVRIGDRLYYHGRRTGTRVVCMEHDERCCLVAYDRVQYEDYGPDACDTTTVFESVVVRGTIRAVDDPDTKMRVLRALTDKLTPAKAGCPVAEERIARTGVFEITMDEVTGKHHMPAPGSRLTHRYRIPRGQRRGM